MHAFFYRAKKATEAYGGYVSHLETHVRTRALRRMCLTPALNVLALCLQLLLAVKRESENPRSIGKILSTLQIEVFLEKISFNQWRWVMKAKCY